MAPERRERLPVSISAAVFIEDDQGRLLLLQQAAEYKGYKWGPPAGGMEAFENPIMAAVREIREEIGVEIKLVDVIGIYTVSRGESASGVGFAFRGKIVSGDVTIRKGEIADYRFFYPEEIQQLISQNLIYKPEYTLSTINDWREGRSYPLEVVKRVKMG